MSKNTLKVKKTRGRDVWSVSPTGEGWHVDAFPTFTSISVHHTRNKTDDIYVNRVKNSLGTPIIAATVASHGRVSGRLLSSSLYLSPEQATALRDALTDALEG